tara:strand:+ start:5122 stop:6192 length:1071 start_codon:yes stop_codon:yes gene_type:complete
MSQIKIKNQIIGENYPTYFIADIAANHDGDLIKAIDLIHLAAEAGADVAKFQHFKASMIVSDYGFKSMQTKSSHQSVWKKSVFETYADASVPDKWTSTLINECKKANIEFFSSPYDFNSVDMLNKHGVKAHKIGSGDITWIEIIEHIAKSGIPVFIASGASDITDVDRAMAVLKKYHVPTCLMQCNTNYTGSLENFNYINLRVLKTYEKLYPDVVLGLSDHTPGHTTVLGAVSLGARVIEKHFTNDNKKDGPDHAFSLDPKSWREMVNSVRELECSLGLEEKKVEENEKETIILQRRAIRLNNNLRKGHILKRDDLSFLRPAANNSIPPYEIDKIIGQELKVEKKYGDYLKYEDFK